MTVGANNVANHPDRDRPHMDPFAALFAHTMPSARTFFSGNLCDSVPFGSGGHLHLLKGGVLKLSEPGRKTLELREPTLIFYPRGRPHSFAGDPERGADLVCATVDLGGEQGNPIGQGLPELIVMPLADPKTLAPVCAMLVAEAFSGGAGRQAALDRLFDYLLILVVRHVVESGGVEGGVLAGLADPNLAKALAAIHATPDKPFTLEDLAGLAGMSRTRFAARFHATIGQAPIAYLTLWRMTVARRLLREGTPVKTTATKVGYTSPAAFARVFARVTGMSPRAAAGAGHSATAQ
jgi:AraC-like DNA-binding protein